MSTRVLTAHVPGELAERLDAYASASERSRAWIMKQALTSWLEWEEKDRLTLEALEEMDRIGGIPHEEVVAYFESLGTERPLPRPLPRKI